MVQRLAAARSGLQTRSMSAPMDLFLLDAQQDQFRERAGTLEKHVVRPGDFGWGRWVSVDGEVGLGPSTPHLGFNRNPMGGCRGERAGASSGVSEG